MISIAAAEKTREVAQHTKLGRPCPTCKFYPFYMDAGAAVIPGHVYSSKGRAELGITGMCEYCWDQMEPEDDRAERTGGAIDPDVPKELPLDGQILQTVTNLNDYDVVSGRYDTDDPEIAQVITSRIDGPGNRHKIVLDLDFPAKLVPSSTEGHFHLYLDHELPWSRYAKLLVALGDAGILEEGYVRASLERQLTAVRLPWVKKPAPSVDEPWPF